MPDKEVTLFVLDAATHEYVTVNDISTRDRVIVDVAKLIAWRHRPQCRCYACIQDDETPQHEEKAT